jgi:threonine dehydratase
MDNDFLKPEDFRKARCFLCDKLHTTPVQSASLTGKELGIQVFLKCENFQKTGSFKVRGATNKIGILRDLGNLKGVITVSAGNHGQGVAWASRMYNIPCTVVMPAGATRSKVDACGGYGATVVLYGTLADAFQKADELAKQHHLVFIHPFDDDDVIAGQGSLGLELLDQIDDINAIIVGVGGGGLISGIGAAVKELKPDIRVVGVEPEGANAMCRSIIAGAPVVLDTVETIADGLASPIIGKRCFEYARKFADDVVTVSDSEIKNAIKILLSKYKMLAEPAGAASFAAILSKKIAFIPNERVVVIISGGNIDMSKLSDILK